MKLRSLVRGDGLRGKSVRSSFLTGLNFGAQSLIRLGGNLILTRILFPEAFGLMALVQVVMAGLNMFSDLGVRASIIQNDRGQDPLFLDTAWVMQIGRGTVLWLVTWVFAAPVAAFYNAPLLAELLPVAGLMALFQGFNSTKLAVANREMQLGRVTLIDIGSKVVGLLVLIALALWLETVWALVIGGLVGPFLMMVLSHTAIPGPRNRFRVDPSATLQLMRFGRFIFLSTMAGFLVSQADRAILGKFITLGDLAIYNIAFMFASVPLMVIRRLTDTVLFPLYRQRPPAASAKNRRDIARARLLIVATVISATALLALTGNALIVHLYDPRYELAGSLVVLISIAILPTIVSGNYGAVILANGHSGRFAVLMIASATLQTAILLAAVPVYGIFGAVMAQFLKAVLLYPFVIWLIRPYGSWVPRQDAIFALAAIATAALSFWINQDALRQAWLAFTPQ